MSAYKLFYVSNATDELKDNGIDTILEASRKNNPAQGITGILLFRSGIFLQLLEGEKAAVDALYEKIQKDPRHSNVINLFTIEDEKRLFDDWAMGFCELGDLDVKMVIEVLSWNKLINAATDIDSNLILHMLERFKNAGNKEKKAG